MKRYLKLAGFLFALGVVTPLTWLERVFTGGTALRPFERVLLGVTALSALWSAGLLILSVPHFAQYAARAHLALPGVSQLLVDTSFFEWTVGGVVATAAVTARLRPLSARSRGILLAVCAFAAMGAAQMIRFGLVMPFVATGCPHP